MNKVIKGEVEIINGKGTRKEANDPKIERNISPRPYGI
jgi:hypothetical protein